MRIQISLPSDVAELLREEAEKNMRAPKHQAAWMLTQQLRLQKELEQTRPSAEERASVVTEEFA